MKFGPVPVGEAGGTILAHSQRVGDRVLKKGIVLQPDDVALLASSGLRTITVARLVHGDVHENEAAERLASAVVPDAAAQGLRLSGAGTGRVNVYSTVAGLVEIDPDSIEAANNIDPMITIATLGRMQRVEPGQMIATIKIISYAVPTDALNRACIAAQNCLRIRQAAYRSATLIETQTGAEPTSEKGREAMRLRLERLGMSLEPRAQVPHKTAPLAAALWQAQGDVILILTASATSDPADVAPASVRAAGGTVTRFGMPVDPGNLLFLGNLQNKPVIGLPGCARSPALNGADWVLERVVCGLDVTHNDIAGMGVGGLLKDIPTRPVPRRKIEG